MGIGLKQLDQSGATEGQFMAFNTASGEWEPNDGPGSDSVSDEVQDDIATGAGVILVDSMTRTPGAGNYMVWFDCSFLLSNNNSEAEFSIFVNSVELTRTRRQGARGGGQTAPTVVPLSINARLIGVLAAQTIEVRAGVDAGTVSIFERTLSLMKVA